MDCSRPSWKPFPPIYIFFVLCYHPTFNFSVCIHTHTYKSNVQPCVTTVFLGVKKIDKEDSNSTASWERREDPTKRGWEGDKKQTFDRFLLPHYYIIIIPLYQLYEESLIPLRFFFIFNPSFYFEIAFNY